MDLEEFLLANNEFGLGHNNMYVDFTRYTKSLINLEMAMEMYKSGLDMMALWDNVGKRGEADQMLMDDKHSCRMNPVHFGLEMMFRSGNMEMLEMDTSAYRLHGFCADDTLSRTCYMLNKYFTNQVVVFDQPLDKDARVVLETLQDTTDHWGEVVTSEYDVPAGEVLEYTVPSLAFVSVTFNWV